LAASNWSGPIVFCASFVPYASETMQTDPTGPILKPWLRAPAVRLRLIRYSSQVPSVTGQAGSGPR
jgi:hypothetical protein